MNETKTKRMRDILLEEIYKRMHKNERIFFLTDDMGAPVVDKLKEEFEEGFIDKGGLDTLILGVLNKKNSKIPVKQFGFKDEYLFMFGNREFLYKQHDFDENKIIKTILSLKN